MNLKSVKFIYIVKSLFTVTEIVVCTFKASPSVNTHTDFVFLPPSLRQRHFYTDFNTRLRRVNLESDCFQLCNW